MITESLFRSRRSWLFALMASLIIMVFQLGGDALKETLIYSRSGIQTGEWYRIASGHWIHFDWTHAYMNMAGLWLLAVIDLENRPIRLYFLSCLALSVAVGLMLYYGEPHVDWYVGLSGVLHGLFVIVLLRSVYLHRDRLSLLVLAILMGKLAWEHYHGALTQGALAAQVIVSAHSYGALAGVVYAGVEGLASWLSAQRVCARSHDIHRD